MKTPTWLPDLSPTPDFQGLRAGDNIRLLWTEDSDRLPARVEETSAFGALVTVDPTDDPAWACGPFKMYVTQRCSDGSWAR